MLDLWLPSWPQSITALWPVPNCTAWWQRHMGVNNLPRVVAWRCTGRESNPWPIDHESDTQTITPPSLPTTLLVVSKKPKLLHIQKNWLPSQLESTAAFGWCQIILLGGNSSIRQWDIAQWWQCLFTVSTDKPSEDSSWRCTNLQHRRDMSWRPSADWDQFLTPSWWCVSAISARELTVLAAADQVLGVRGSCLC